MYGGAENLGSAIGFDELLGNFKYRDAANDFNFSVVKGRETKNANANLFGEYLLDEINSIYVFKLGIIPRKTGIYRISLSNVANVYRRNN